MSEEKHLMTVKRRVNVTREVRRKLFDPPRFANSQGVWAAKPTGPLVLVLAAIRNLRALCLPPHA